MSASLALVDPIAQLVETEALTATGLVLSDPDMPADRFEAIGRWLGTLRDMTAWALGDWMIFGEGVYGHESYQLAEAAGRSPATMQNYRWVASRVVRSRRRDGLSWSHHEAVAALEPRGQRRWLDKAERERLSVVELRALVKAARESESSGAASGPSQVLPPPEPVTLSPSEAETIAGWIEGASHHPIAQSIAERLTLAARNGSVEVRVETNGNCPGCGRPFDG